MWYILYTYMYVNMTYILIIFSYPRDPHFGVERVVRSVSGQAEHISEIWDMYKHLQVTPHPPEVAKMMWKCAWNSNSVNSVVVFDTGCAVQSGTVAWVDGQLLPSCAADNAFRYPHSGSALHRLHRQGC